MDQHVVYVCASVYIFYTYIKIFLYRNRRISSVIPDVQDNLTPESSLQSTVHFLKSPKTVSKMPWWKQWVQSCCMSLDMQVSI